MTISVFDLFKVGIGPSSSHTVGPMRAAYMFVVRLTAGRPARGRRTASGASCSGRWAPPGTGTAASRRWCSGWRANSPTWSTRSAAEPRWTRCAQRGQLRLAGEHPIAFDMDDDVVLHRRKRLDFHTNGMVFRACDADGSELRPARVLLGRRRFRRSTRTRPATRCSSRTRTPVRYPFRTGEELLAPTRETGLRISDIMLANELVLAQRGGDPRRAAAHLVGDAGMRRAGHAHHRGAARRAEGPPPGGRAATPSSRPMRDEADPLRAMEWVTLYALAVNEENAAGGRVVTAPTNGAAGIVPAGPALLPRLHRLLLRRRRGPVPADRRRDRPAVQGERLDLRRRGGLPG